MHMHDACNRVSSDDDMVDDAEMMHMIMKMIIMMMISRFIVLSYK